MKLYTEKKLIEYGKYCHINAYVFGKHDTLNNKNSIGQLPPLPKEFMLYEQELTDDLETIKL